MRKKNGFPTDACQPIVTNRLTSEKPAKHTLFLSILSSSYSFFVSSPKHTLFLSILSSSSYSGRTSTKPPCRSPSIQNGRSLLSSAVQAPHRDFSSRDPREQKYTETAHPC